MKIRMGRMPGDAPASLSYASGNGSHVPCAGGRVKLTPFTRCSRVLQALQDLLLSNTYLKKKNQSLPALSGKFLFWSLFFFFFNLLDEIGCTCFHSRVPACKGLLLVNDGQERSRQPGPDLKGQRPEVGLWMQTYTLTDRHADVHPPLRQQTCS